jgi:hypothetical protein
MIGTAKSKWDNRKWKIIWAHFQVWIMVYLKYRLDFLMGNSSQNQWLYPY